jgi:hypothetical protein
MNKEIVREEVVKAQYEYYSNAASLWKNDLEAALERGDKAAACYYFSTYIKLKALVREIETYAQPYAIEVW